MEQFETRLKQVDVLPMVQHFIDELNLFSIFTKHVPAAAGNLASHAQKPMHINGQYHPREQAAVQGSRMATTRIFGLTANRSCWVSKYHGSAEQEDDKGRRWKKN